MSYTNAAKEQEGMTYSFGLQDLEKECDYFWLICNMI